MRARDDALILIELAQRYPEQRSTLMEIAGEILSPNEDTSPTDGSGRPEGGDSRNEADPLFPLDVFHRYKGEKIVGKLFEDGTVDVNGRRLKPSPAAMIFTNNNVNGWDWWRYRDPIYLMVRKIDHLRRQRLIRED